MDRNELNHLTDGVLIYNEPCPEFSLEDREFIIACTDEEYSDYTKEEAAHLNDRELLENYASYVRSWVACNI